MWLIFIFIILILCHTHFYLKTRIPNLPELLFCGIPQNLSVWCARMMFLIYTNYFITKSAWLSSHFYGFFIWLHLYLYFSQFSHLSSSQQKSKEFLSTLYMCSIFCLLIFSKYRISTRKCLTVFFFKSYQQRAPCTHILFFFCSFIHKKLSIFSKLKYT